MTDRTKIASVDTPAARPESQATRKAATEATILNFCSIMGLA